MGNSGSSCADVVLHLHDESRTYTAGSTLSGEIRCPRDCSLSSNALARRGVRLHFIGKEDVEVVVSSAAAPSSSSSSVGERRRGRKRKSKVAKRDVARFAIAIDFSPGREEDAASSASSCVYPFAFRIPDNLPSSVYLEDESGGHCSVRYKLKMRTTMMAGSERREEVVPITIIAKSPRCVGTPPMPNRAGGTQKIKFMRCVPRGRVSWHAGVHDDRVGVGENLIVNLAIRNDSRVRIVRVSAALEETATWRASRRRSSCVFRSIDPHPSNFSLLPTYNDDIGRKRRRRLAIPSPRARRTQRGTEGGRTITSSSLVDGRRNDDNDQVDMVLTFPIPEYVHQSYSGRLFTIRHRVRIDAKTPAFYTSPRMSIPIVVVRPRDDFVPVVVATAIMAPTVAPSAPPLEYEERAPTTPSAPPLEYEESAPSTASASTSALTSADARARADEGDALAAAAIPMPPGSPPPRSRSDRAAAGATSAAVVPVGRAANEGDDDCDSAALKSERYDTTLDGLTIIPPPPSLATLIESS